MFVTCHGVLVWIIFKSLFKGRSHTQLILDGSVKILSSHCVLFFSGWEGAELQRPHSRLLLSADFHCCHHHAVFPDECVFQQGQPGSCLQRHHLLYSLPAPHPLLRLAGPHHEKHEVGCCMSMLCFQRRTHLILEQTELSPIITCRYCSFVTKRYDLFF